MLMFWKYKEIYMGNSMQEFSRIRNILEINKIKYDYRVVHNNRSADREGFGSFGERPEYSYMYYAYVHKRDYEKAYSFIYR